LADLGKSRRDQDRPDHPLLATLLEDLRDEASGDAKDSDIHRPWNILYAAIAWASQNFVGARVDGVELPRVAAVDDIFHHRIADLPLLRRGADDGDGLGHHDALHLRPHHFGRWPRPGSDRSKIGDDACIDSDRTGGAGHDRIQIHFGDLREVGRQLRGPDNQAGEGFLVRGRLAAHPMQNGSAAELIEHLESLGMGGGRQSEGGVLQRLDKDTSQPKYDDRAESRIANDADDDLVPTRYHLLDLHANDLGISLIMPSISQNRAVRL